MSDLVFEKVSIEEQILRAKKRAEEFSNSLQRARTREQEIIQTFEREKISFEQDKSNYEKEKSKLMKSYEDKTAGISSLVGKALHTTYSDSTRSPVGSPIRPGKPSNAHLGNMDLDSPFFQRALVSEPTLVNDFESETVRLRSELKRLMDEVVNLRSSHQEMEGKLQFRLDQVRQNKYESASTFYRCYITLLLSCSVYLRCYYVKKKRRSYRK
jgi:hypothetical protein